MVDAPRRRPRDSARTVLLKTVVIRRGPAERGPQRAPTPGARRLRHAHRPGRQRRQRQDDDLGPADPASRCRGRPVVAVDADINQHLGAALGLSGGAGRRAEPDGGPLPAIKEYLRGDNPLIADAATMVKTTPPGRGSRLLRLERGERCPQPVRDAAGRRPGDVRLMVTGGFEEKDLGVSCYHSKVGAAELYLNHLVDGPDEYLVDGHDRGRGRLRLRPVHPLRPDLPGGGADPQVGVRLPAVPRVRQGVRRHDPRGRQQGDRPGRHRLPARAHRHRPRGLSRRVAVRPRPRNRAGTRASTPWSRPTAPPWRVFSWKWTPCRRTGRGSPGRRSTSI